MARRAVPQGEKRGPGRPRKDAQAKVGLNINARYDAAGAGRRMKGWNPPSTGPNKAIVGLQKIRDRARDVARNDWSGASATQKWVTNLVGIGIVPRLNKDVPVARKKELTKLWDRWVEVADADGVLNFYGLQALAVRAWLDSGEVFVRKRVRRLDSGMEVPLQVQLIEAEFVPLLDADTQPGMPTGNRIRSGIELDRRGQRVAYWMYREHPGDGFSGAIDISKLLRVPAAEVRHIFEPTRPGQLRGVSALAPVLARLRNIADFDDAVLERQKLANLFVAFITRGTGASGDLDPLTNLPMEMDGGSPLAGMEPGLMQELDYGQDVKFANPPEAGTDFGGYMRTQQMGTAAGSGLPYELFSGDIKDVSDRTLRVLINEFRRFAEQRQWQVVIPMLCRPVRRWWTEVAFMAGLVGQSEVEDVAMVEWAPHGWAHIHPVQDPQGKQIEVDAGFRSRSSVIAERGDDPDAVDEERAADSQREKDLGLYADPTGTLDGNGNPVAPDPAEADPAEDPAGGAPANAYLAFQAAFQALAERPQPQPAPITVNNHMPAPLVQASVAAPNVSIENVVQPTPVQVEAHVAAPNVTVQNQVDTPAVHVAAPTVTVQNEVQPSEVVVHLPARKTETTIARDRAGNIVKATQIETDADEPASE